jgi:uncharacterized membrane protein
MNAPNKRKDSYLIIGVLLMGIGLIWLLNTMGIELPAQLFSMPTFTVIIGLITLVKSKFKSELGWVIFSFGVVWTFEDMLPHRQILQLGTASIVLLLGGYYLLKYFTSDKEKQPDANK